MISRLDDAIDFAFTNGLIKRAQTGQLKHVPFSLTPYLITSSEQDQLEELTPLFNDVMTRVGDDSAYLEDRLAEVVRTDTFTKQLMSLMKETTSDQPAQLLLSRSDYIAEKPEAGLVNRSHKQVEFNMISNSFPFMATKTYDLHRYLYQTHSDGQRLVPNGALSGYSEAMAKAVEYYDSTNSCILMVVQPGESNIFDQRGLEYEILKNFGYPTVRMTLEQIAANSRIQNGHLMVDGYIAALTYFRAGYTPSDYKNKDAWRGRQIIEASSSIKCPTIGAQLAGTKKIQQVLTNPAELSLFAEPAVAEKLSDTFVKIYSMTDTIDGQSVVDIAMERSDEYVLKPQREGGGNNLYNQELVECLDTSTEDELMAYILMEKIRAMDHPSVLVVEGQSSKIDCISEIGRYGACLREGSNMILNNDCGYLVRTKAREVNEGGVSAGFACLNSLILKD